MPISGYRFLLKDVVDVLLEDENEELEVDGIYIAPPQVNIDSDEDSADEDEGGLSDDLTGRQLRADAEIDLRNRNRISNEEKLRGAHQPPQYSIACQRRLDSRRSCDIRSHFSGSKSSAVARFVSSSVY